MQEPSGTNHDLNFFISSSTPTVIPINNTTQSPSVSPPQSFCQLIANKPQCNWYYVNKLLRIFICFIGCGSFNNFVRYTFGRKSFNITFLILQVWLLAHLLQNRPIHIVKSSAPLLCNEVLEYVENGLKWTWLAKTRGITVIKGIKIFWIPVGCCNMQFSRPSWRTESKWRLMKHHCWRKRGANEYHSSWLSTRYSGLYLIRYVWLFCNIFPSSLVFLSNPSMWILISDNPYP